MPQIQTLSRGPQPSGSPETASLPHVLLVVDGFPKTLGGGERIVLRLASLLPGYGFRASILTFALHPESSFRPADAPCPVYLLPLRNTYGTGALRGAFALRRLLRSQKVCLVQTFFESSDLWAGLVTRLFSPARLIWSRRDMGILRGSKHHLAYRALRRLPHAVFAVSARVAEHVIAVDKVDPARVHVVYNGLDLQPSLQPSPPLAASPPVITTIGNIRHVKGHDVFLEAAATVLTRFPAARFTVAGEVLEPAYFEALQRRTEVLGLAESFHFIGKVSDLGRHLHTASVFVLPSRSEGFSNALIEAMAEGLPSIATDVGGNAEAIENGQSGLIVPAEDAPALATAIEAVLSDPELALRLSLGARHTVEANFTSAAMMQKVVDVYHKVLAM